MKRILTIFLAVAGIFFATATQAQSRDFNKTETYPSKEYRQKGDFKHGKEMKNDRKFRHGRKHPGRHHHRHYRHHGRNHNGRA